MKRMTAGSLDRIDDQSHPALRRLAEQSTEAGAVPSA
jgi:hypothetical protein